jgi:hypothetical protein
MPDRLINSLQIKMGYPMLQKIDPNTQAVIEPASTMENRFGQAALPAVLTALCKYSDTDDGAGNILQGYTPAELTTLLFKENKDGIIGMIAGYSSCSTGYAEEKTNLIAATAVHLIKQELPVTATIQDVRKYLAGQKNDILLYLPAELQMGVLLHENTLDDRTNKMEGPLSSLMHTIGGQFSGGEITKDPS